VRGAFHLRFGVSLIVSAPLIPRLCFRALLRDGHWWPLSFATSGREAVLDLNGEMLGSQDIETGAVCSTATCSALLFDIYVDALVRRIDDFAAKRGDAAGVPLPRVGANLFGPPPAAPSLLEVMYYLFFTDDGVLLARDRATLHLMLNAVVAELGEICLLLNAKKTKVLLVPLLTATEAQYEATKRDVSSAGGFTARG
jgi:hypothetical protein